jgi:hypothetical protein
MGTWGTNIKDNDTFQDIYTSFFDRYNSGKFPKEISQALIDENKELINDMDDSNPFWLGLALAQWETKSLDPDVYSKVKDIIDSGKDLELWEGTDTITIKKRQKALESFLKKISTEKEKAKRRIRPKPLDFYSNELINLISPDQKKTFTLCESGTSKGHNYTGAYISWSGSGGSIFFYDKPNRNISAKWLDSQTIMIRHDKEIVFSKQDFQTQYYTDIIKILYVSV